MHLSSFLPAGQVGVQCALTTPEKAEGEREGESQSQG